MSLLDALLLDPAPFQFWIAKRTDGIKGSGLTPGDPWDGGTQARFDEAMNLFANQSNVTIPLGPGEFFTNGYNGTTGWQARPGLKNGIVQENIIDFGGANPNHHLHSENVRSFNNTTSSGTLVRGHTETYPDDPEQKDVELATLIEDAMLMGF